MRTVTKNRERKHSREFGKRPTLPPSAKLPGYAFRQHQQLCRSSANHGIAAQSRPKTSSFQFAAQLRQSRAKPPLAQRASSEDRNHTRSVLERRVAELTVLQGAA